MITLDEWIKELESGDHKKGKELLVNNKDEKCCLGVIATVDDDFTIDRKSIRYSGWFKLNKSAHVSSTYLLNLDGEIIYVGADFALTEFDQTNLSVINDKSDTFDPVVEFIKLWEDKFRQQYGTYFRQQ